VNVAAIPQPEHTTARAVVQWRERTTDTGHRPHLGASVIGHSCDRHLWLMFRWAGSEAFDGRVLRMFERGRREEALVHEELRGIGCEVWADDGTGQYRVAAVAGHFGGSLDGVVVGLPEAPKATHVLEVKTHGAKSFADLKKKGVRESKPMHWQQMQTYMHLADIDRALYYAVNKDTDELHIERIERDPAEGERILARAQKIVTASEPPLRLSEDPDYFECKWCRFKPQCHGTEAPEVNCRTCAHSTPTLAGDAQWTCGKTNRPGVIPINVQRAGCASHLYIPPMLDRIGKPVDGDESSVVYESEHGRFVNGPPPGFSSAEIRAAEHKDMLCDPGVQSIKGQFEQARLVA